MEALVEFFSPNHTSYITLTWWNMAALVAAGLVGGCLNTFAGGASMITVPTLMLLGMPADHANGTNRLGILFGAISGVREFNKRGRLDKGAILPMFFPLASGAALGALSTTWLPPDVLKPILLGSMIAIAAVTLLLPDVVAPPEGTTNYTLRERPIGILMLFGAGFYGGFVQAGVGFVLIAALAVGLRYDLLRTMALKIVATALFGAVSLTVFVLTDRVEWISGAFLAAGMATGALISVRFAINADKRVIRWILLIAVCAATASVFIFK